MARAKWTKWIKHVPGNALPPIGFQIMIEELGISGKPKRKVGVMNAKAAAALHWSMKDRFGSHTMITRYKFRIIEDDAKDDARVVRKIKEPA